MDTNTVLILTIIVLVTLVLLFREYREVGRLSRKTEELRLRAERAEKIRDDFMANVSHELRTPINTIIGMGQIILQNREDLPEDLETQVEDIVETGEELFSTVSLILDYAELQSDTIRIQSTEYRLIDLLNRVVRDCTEKAEEKNVDILVDMDPSMPRTLLGDFEKIYRVLYNIMDNAIKFTENGCVVLQASYRLENYGANIRFAVRDTGIGMTREERERIFENFYQADSSRTRDAGGTGMGLTLSYAIVKKLGGFFSIASKVEEGSEFSFTIPQKIADATPCIELTSNEEVSILGFFDLETFRSPVIRNCYVDTIRHMKEYLKVNFHLCQTKEEFTRRIERENFTHLFIDFTEYRSDVRYYEELTSIMKVCVILGPDQTIAADAKVSRLYKPIYALSIAEILDSNSKESISSAPVLRKKTASFVAPDAKVLVVDDNRMNLSVAEGLMRPYLMRITAVTSGRAAIELLEKEDFDLIFMDHMMPQMDGIEALHIIRNMVDPACQQVPIIVLTANAVAGAREMFLSEGFSDFLAKPIDIEGLNDILEKYLPKELQEPSVSEPTLDIRPRRKRDTVPTVEEESKEIEVQAVEDFSAYRKELTESTEISLDALLDIPGVDPATASQYCGGVAELYMEVARVYIDCYEEMKENLAHALHSHDMPSFETTVHALKSSSLTIGAVELSELARTMEGMASEGREEEIRNEYDHLMELYDKLIVEMKAKPELSGQEA